MRIYKRGETWWLRDGKKRTSLGTQNETHARELFDQYERGTLGIFEGPVLAKHRIFERFGKPDVAMVYGRMKFPCVYVVLRKQEIVYVGSSVNGFKRPLENGHPMEGRFLNPDTILFWHFKTERQARDTEINMIRTYRPKGNLDAAGRMRLGSMGQDMESRKLSDVIRKAIRQEFERSQTT